MFAYPGTVTLALKRYDDLVAAANKAEPGHDSDNGTHRERLLNVVTKLLQSYLFCEVRCVFGGSVILRQQSDSLAISVGTPNQPTVLRIQHEDVSQDAPGTQWRITCYVSRNLADSEHRRQISEQVVNTESGMLRAVYVDAWSSRVSAWVAETFPERTDRPDAAKIRKRVAKSTKQAGKSRSRRQSQ